MKFDHTNPPAQRVPGLFRAWDVSQVLAGGRSYLIETVGQTGDGAALFAIYLIDKVAT